MGLINKTPVEKARAEVGKARELLARWEAEQGSAQAELADLQRRAGDDVLDDPDAALRLPRAMGELRDRIDVAERATVSARQRVTVAERAFIAADADSREPAVAAARKALADFDAKTVRLVEQLKAHTGRDYVLAEVLDSLRYGPQTITRHRLPLERALEGMEQPLNALRSLLAGEQPAVPAYPDTVWGPTAVVPAPAYLASVERQAQAAHRNRLEREKVVARIAELESGVVEYETGRFPDNIPRLLEQERERLRNLDEALAQAPS